VRLAWPKRPKIVCSPSYVDIRSRANTTRGLDFEHMIKARAHKRLLRICMIKTVSINLILTFPWALFLGNKHLHTRIKDLLRDFVNNLGINRLICSVLDPFTANTTFSHLHFST
jgi:hypothetical protein